MRTSTIIRLSCVNAIGFSGSTVMPLWLGTIAGHLSMPPWFASAAVLSLLGAAALFNLATPLIFRTVALLPLARASLAVAALAYLLATIRSPVPFILACLVTGAALGTLLNVTNRLMGSHEHVQKGYAIFQLIEICFATALFLGCTTMIASFGLSAMFPLTALTAPLGLLLLHRLPLGRAMPAVMGETEGPRQRGRAVITLIAFGLFFIGQAMINSFMPIIGQAAGLGAERAGQMVGIGMPFGFAGALLARMIGERISPTMAIALTVLVLAIAAPCVTFAPGVALFMTTVILLFAFTIFSVPYFFAQLGKLDRHGRYTAFGPSMMLTGLAIGPSAAVLIQSRIGLPAVGVFASIFLFMAGATFALATLPRRPAPVPAIA
nr:hypothetical protein [Sphingomonas sp. Y57]